MISITGRVNVGSNFLPPFLNYQLKGPLRGKIMSVKFSTNAMKAPKINGVMANMAALSKVKVMVWIGSRVSINS